MAGCATGYETEMKAMLDRAREVEATLKGVYAEANGLRRPVEQPARDIVQKALRDERETYRKDVAEFNPFRNLGDFCKAVREITISGGNWSGHKKMDTWVKGYNGYVQKTQPTGYNETLGADGGYLVAPQFIAQLLERTYDNDLLSRTMLFPMTSNKLAIPCVDETSRVDGSRFGGVLAVWDGEVTAGTMSKAQFAQIDLLPDGLTAFLKATDDMLNDTGGSLEAFANRVVPQELTFKIGDAIVRGDGVRKPRGILNSPALVTVAAETGQPAATIMHENIVKMWSRMFGPCRANAVWLINQDVEPALNTMTLGTAGSQLASYLPQGGLNAAPYATLMGRPIIPVEFCSTLGTVGDIILADLGSYATGTIGGIMSAVSMHVSFLTSEQVFRFRMRIAGQSWWKSALTPYQGTNTLSPFVALATRS